jgi:DNA-binding response OmpR family regulator
MTTASGREKKGLVVEDEPTIAKMCIRVLVAEGFEVDVAIDGKAAQDLLRKNPYDLCLIDIRTPGMSGIELYQRLEDECPKMKNRVIFTTGDVINDNIRTFLDETGRPFLPKPFTPSELRSKIKIVFSSREKSKKDG